MWSLNHVFSTVENKCYYGNPARALFRIHSHPHTRSICSVLCLAAGVYFVVGCSAVAAPAGSNAASENVGVAVVVCTSKFVLRPRRRQVVVVVVCVCPHKLSNGLTSLYVQSTVCWSSCSMIPLFDLRPLHMAFVLCRTAFPLDAFYRSITFTSGEQVQSNCSFDFGLTPRFSPCAVRPSCSNQ